MTNEIFRERVQEGIISQAIDRQMAVLQTTEGQELYQQFTDKIRQRVDEALSQTGLEELANDLKPQLEKSMTPSAVAQSTRNQLEKMYSGSILDDIEAIEAHDVLDPKLVEEVSDHAIRAVDFAQRHVDCTVQLAHEIGLEAALSEERQYEITRAIFPTAEEYREASNPSRVVKLAKDLMRSAVSEYLPDPEVDAVMSLTNDIMDLGLNYTIELREKTMNRIIPKIYGE